jgi:hypothetical protein
LSGFLRRELDFYVKNEVMHLDDVENETAPRVEQYLSKIKVIRRVAGKIIDFLAQLEDFQKKLWLKKKFVDGFGKDYQILNLDEGTPPRRVSGSMPARILSAAAALQGAEVRVPPL